MLSLELLRNAEVFAPSALGSVDLLVAGGRIAWIGSGAPALPGAFEVLERDLSGARLVPGFVDGHAHVTGGGGESGYASRVPPMDPSAFTRAGVTSVVGLLGTDDTVRTTGELLAGVRGLCEVGLSAWCYTGGYHLPPTTLTGSVRGDIVHVDRIIGVGELAISDHRSSQPTLDELLRVAADAHVAGLMSGKAGTLHLHLGDGERGLELVRRALETSELPPGTFHPTHLNRRLPLLEEGFELAGRGVPIDLTAFPEGDVGEGCSAAEGLQRALAAGVEAERVTISSDGGGCLPVFDGQGRVASMGVGTPAVLAETLAELVAKDVPLATALLPFTANPARVLRLPGKGRVEVGADADLVVLDDRHRVTDVMAMGVWHVVAGEAVVRGPFERRAGGHDS